MDQTTYIHFIRSDSMMTKADDIDECNALAYANINGFADENGKRSEEGVVICRVWLLENTKKKKRFLVDWNYEEYRSNEGVIRQIKNTKTELVRYHTTIVENILYAAYERYKLQWMIDHKKTLEQLISALQTQMTDGAETIYEAYDEFQMDQGFAGELWVCEQEFRETEAQNDDVIKKLLTKDEYEILKKSRSEQ